MPADSRPILIALPLLAAAAVLVLVALPGLDGPLMLDSTKLHSLAPIVEEHGNGAVWHTPGFGGGLERIVAMASFVLNIQAAGEVSPFAIKLTNVLIHVLAGLLVFLLTRLMLRRTAYSEWATGAATAASVLWLVSPLNLNVALYGVQRMAQLSALFTFAGLALYTAGRLHERAGPRWAYLALAALVCLPLAVLSKQNGILLVPLAFLVEVYFLHPARPAVSGRQLALIAVLGAVAALVLLFYFYPGALNYQHRDFTLAERLLSQPRALVSYLQQLLAPVSGDTGIYNDDFAASQSLLSPPSTALSLLACAAIAVFCVAGYRGRLRPAAFGLAFFLVGHAVESTFIPLELYFLHRNYLPGYGIYFALVALLFVARIPRRWLIVTLALYAAYFAAIGYARSMTWSSRAGIVSAAVHHHPDSPRALANYAQLAVERGRFDVADSAIGRVIELTGTLNARVQQLYIRCRTGGGIDPGAYEALADIRSFGVSTELSQALGNLLGLYERGGCSRLNAPRLVQTLDTLAARYLNAGGDPWSLLYYADSFLYASGERGRAHQRLQSRLEAGHLESGLYRLDLLIQEGSRNEAQSVLNQIEAGFSPERLERYADTLVSFRRRVEGMR